MTINKSEALRRLSAIEQESKELRRIIEAPEKITDRVKTYEDACSVLGIDPDYDDFDNLEEDEIAYIKLKRIVKALNEGWNPDWNNSNQRKWFNWWYLDQPGFRFYGAYFLNSITVVAPRLTFVSEEIALYAAKQFFNLFKEYYTK